jgi:hypothetical protein
MEKYIVQIEFRYNAIPKSDSPYASDCYDKTITIGIYDSIDDAIKQGNKSLEVLKTKFSFNECFSKHGGPFGRPKDLVCNFEKRNKPQFFAKIETLHFDDLPSVMEDVFNAHERWMQNKE